MDDDVETEEQSNEELPASSEDDGEVSGMRDDELEEPVSESSGSANGQQRRDTTTQQGSNRQDRPASCPYSLRKEVKTPKRYQQSLGSSSLRGQGDVADRH